MGGLRRYSVWQPTHDCTRLCFGSTERTIHVIALRLKVFISYLLFNGYFPLPVFLILPATLQRVVFLTMLTTIQTLINVNAATANN